MTLETQINTSKIAIICNSQYKDLYQESLSFYKDIEFDKIVVDGNNKFYSINFLIHVIETYNKYDWAIFIDEDCFITNKQAMLDLLKYQIQHNIDFSGPPDGGVISHRFHNPVSINTFFTIINLKKIRSVYNKKQIMDMKYDDSLKKYTPSNLLKKGLNLKYDNYEPYYRLFFWMLKKGMKPLYLDVRNYNKPGDNLSTVLKNQNGVEFAYHSWMSRRWADSNQNGRILDLIKDAKQFNK
jgi:hypothetical protein